MLEEFFNIKEKEEKKVESNCSLKVGYCKSAKNRTNVIVYVHIFSTDEACKGEGEGKNAEGGEDKRACKGGERQREDWCEAAATTRTPP